MNLKTSVTPKSSKNNIKTKEKLVLNPSNTAYLALNICYNFFGYNHI